MNKQRLTKIFDENRPSTPMTEDETKFFMHLIMSSWCNYKKKVT